MLKHYVSPFQDDHGKYLLMVEFAYNNSWQEFIKTTPILFNNSQHPSTFVNPQSITGDFIQTKASNNLCQQ